MSFFPSKINILWLFVTICSRVLSCFHHRYDSACKKYPSKCIFIEFLYKAKFQLILSKAIALRFSRFFQNFWKCLISLYLSSFPSRINILWLFVTICSMSFSENLKQLTKMNDFLLFLLFHENRRILHCFHRRYEFCMQKYPSKCIFIEFP